MWLAWPMGPLPCDGSLCCFELFTIVARYPRMLSSQLWLAPLFCPLRVCGSLRCFGHSASVAHSNLLFTTQKWLACLTRALGARWIALQLWTLLDLGSLFNDGLSVARAHSDRTGSHTLWFTQLRWSLRHFGSLSCTELSECMARSAAMDTIVIGSLRWR